MQKDIFKTILKADFSDFSTQEVGAPRLNAFKAFQQLDNPQCQYSFRLSKQSLDFILLVYKIDHSYSYNHPLSLEDSVDTSFYLLSYFKHSNGNFKTGILTKMSFVEEWIRKISTNENGNLAKVKDTFSKFETGGFIECKPNQCLTRPFLAPIDSTQIKAVINLTSELNITTHNT